MNSHLAFVALTLEQNIGTYSSGESKNYHRTSKKISNKLTNNARSLCGRVECRTTIIDINVSQCRFSPLQVRAGFNIHSKFKALLNSCCSKCSFGRIWHGSLTTNLQLFQLNSQRLEEIFKNKIK